MLVKGATCNQVCTGFTHNNPYICTHSSYARHNFYWQSYIKFSINIFTPKQNSKHLVSNMCKCIFNENLFYGSNLTEVNFQGFKLWYVSIGPGNGLLLNGCNTPLKHWLWYWAQNITSLLCVKTSVVLQFYILVLHDFSDKVIPMLKGEHLTVTLTNTILLNFSTYLLHLIVVFPI